MSSNPRIERVNLEMNNLQNALANNNQAMPTIFDKRKDNDSSVLSYLINASRCVSGMQTPHQMPLNDMCQIVITQ